jgi:hypothetical protein
MQATHRPVTEQTVTTPAATLRAAAHYLARHGWTQGGYYEPTGTGIDPAACVVGAIGVVCYGEPNFAPAMNYNAPAWAEFDTARQVLDDYLLPRYGQEAYGFNDDRDRTAEQVIGALHAAAERWEQTQGGGR